MAKGGTKMSYYFEQIHFWVKDMKPWLLMAATGLFFGLLVIYAKTR